MFNPLTREEVAEIVKLQFKGVQKLLLDNDIKVDITEEAIEWLAQLGFDPQFGARPLKRVIQKKILNELSKEIIGGKINKEDSILIAMDKKHNFTFKNAKEKAEAL
jgi:ATP-dependent Clp protease ATP-binding subunit ClpB